MQNDYPIGGFAGGGPGYMSVSVPQESGMDDRAEDYIPEIVKQYLVYFRKVVAEKNVPVILDLYENEFQRLSSRWFREYPWPEAEKISELVENDEVFLHLYRELHYRHVYAMHKPTVTQRIESYYMYCSLFDFFLNRESPLDLDLPNQWLWEIIDEFLYQYLQFVQYRSSKFKGKLPEDVKELKGHPRVWDVHSIMNILYSLVAKSGINHQLEVFQEGGDPASVAGEFGNRSLYKNLGYFSLIGLLRLHCQLGDYYLGLESVKNVQLSKKVLANTRVPASQISLHYHAGFCYLMARRYHDTIRVFSNIIGYIQRAKQHFPQDSYQLKQVMKQNDQMLSLLSIVLTLYPQHVDETVNTQLKERFAEKQAKLHKGDKKVIEEMFLAACPKFITPSIPEYDAVLDTTGAGKEMVSHHCTVFMEEIEQQIILPNIRSYLRFYTTMPIAKLAAFMEMDDEELRSILVRYKHKVRAIQTSRPLGPVAAEAQSMSEIDFYIDGDMIHIADTKVARRYGDFFIRQIHKFNVTLGLSPTTAKPMII